MGAKLRSERKEINLLGLNLRTQECFSLSDRHFDYSQYYHNSCYHYHCYMKNVNNNDFPNHRESLGSVSSNIVFDILSNSTFVHILRLWWNLVIILCHQNGDFLDTQAPESSFVIIHPTKLSLIKLKKIRFAQSKKVSSLKHLSRFEHLSTLHLIYEQPLSLKFSFMMLFCYHGNLK